MEPRGNEDPVICHCLQVTRADLVGAMATHPGERLAKFFDRTKITTVCTSCRWEVIRDFQDWQERQKTYPGLPRTFLGHRWETIAGLLPTKSRLTRFRMKLRQVVARLAVKPVIHERFYRTFFIHDGNMETFVGFARFINPDITQPRRPFGIRIRGFDMNGKLVLEHSFPLRLEEVREIALAQLVPEDFCGSGYVEIRVRSGGLSRSFAWLQGTLRPYITLVRKDGLRATVHEKSKFLKGRAMLLPPFRQDAPFSIELILANTNEREVHAVLSLECGAEAVTVPYTLARYASRRERLTDLIPQKPGLWTGYLTADGALVEYVLIQDKSGGHFAIQHS